MPGANHDHGCNGVTSVDARNTTNLAAYKGTDISVEDAPDQSVGGREFLRITTTTNETYALDLQNNMICFRRSEHHRPCDRTSGRRRMASPDNLAVDHDGNVCIIEDRNGGVDDDIWFAVDLNKDGDL